MKKLIKKKSSGDKSLENNIKQYAKKNVNLLPKKYLTRNKRRFYILLGILLIAAVITLAVLEYYNTLAEIKDLEKQNTLIQKELTIRNEEVSNIKLLYALKEGVDEKVVIIKQIQNAHASATSVSRYIENNLPDGVVYLNLSFDSSNGVQISGRTTNKEEIPDFLHKIREIDRFSSVVISTISKVEQQSVTGTELGNAPTMETFEYYEFAFECTIGGEEDDTE